MGTFARPRLLDVTLRDGGYVNGWKFSATDAAKIVCTAARGGIPYIEVGYYRPRLGNDTGVENPGPMWCPRDYLSAVAQVRGDSDLVVMVHLKDVETGDYVFLADHGITRVRFVAADANVRQLEAHINAAHGAGLACSVNLIRLSARPLDSVISLAREAESIGADWIYAADSNGSMFPGEVEKVFQELRASGIAIPLGFHAHDSLHLAFANSLAAARAGAELLDCSLGGMGKGGGNLVTELITAYFKFQQDEKFEITMLSDVACQTLGPWIGPDHCRRCENMLSALLDLNVDDLKAVRTTAEQMGRPLLLELERNFVESSMMTAAQPLSVPR
jgi:4-hydroxy 2-oxovalerate aldolase